MSRQKKIHLLIAIFLIVCMAVSPLGAVAAGRHGDPVIVKYSGQVVVGPETVWDLFDAGYYVAAYGGLLSASSDEEALYREYMDEGLAAGRSCSPYLNLPVYRSTYPDLDARFGDDWDAYVDYYFRYGMDLGQSDGTSARDASIRRMLEGESATGRGRSASDEDEATSANGTATPGHEDENEDEDETPDEPQKFINQNARQNITGLRFYDQLTGDGAVTLDNAGLEGTFHPETYRDIRSRTGDEQKYTVMLYLCGSDLESKSSKGTGNLIKLLSAQYDLDKVNVLVLAGGSLRWKNKAMSAVNDGDNACLYYLDPTAVQSDGTEGFWTDGNADQILTADAQDGSSRGSLRLLSNLGQISMAEPELLLGFMDAAYDLFPADHYWLIMNDHGNGSAEGICVSEQLTEDNEEFYKGRVISGDMMTLAKLEEALSGSKIYRERGGLDILNMDACLMGGIEVAYNVMPYAQYLTASEETTYGLNGYDEWLKLFRAELGEIPSARELAALVSKTYVESHPADGTLVSTHACYDLKGLEDFGARMERFGRAMTALISDDATAGDTFDAFYGATVRSVSFGSELNEATRSFNYVDMYGMLKNLYGNLWSRGQAALTAGDEAAADKYTEAMRAISELWEAKFIVYRGFQAGKAFGLSEEAGEGELLSIDMTGSEYTNLWKAGDFGQVCGIDIYVPFIDSEDPQPSDPLNNYLKEGVFPAYVEFLRLFREKMSTSEFKKRIEDGNTANSENISRLFSGISTSRYDWSDKSGKAHSDILVKVKFDQNGREDMVASFLFSTSNTYGVDVLRHARATDRETGEARDLDVIVGESDEAIPVAIFIAGEVSVETDEAGQKVVVDSTGLTIDTGLMSFIAYYVRGETEKTDEGTFATDYATLKDSESSEAITRFKEGDDRAKQPMLTVSGTVSYGDEEGDRTTKDADLVFVKDEDHFIYGGAVIKDNPDDEDDNHYTVIRADDDGLNSTIALDHYTVEDGKKVKVESKYDLDRPVFIIDQGRTLPTLWLIDPSKIEPEEDYDTEYNRYALEFENMERVYVDQDGGYVNQKSYDQFDGIGEIVSREDEATDHGPLVKGKYIQEGDTQDPEPSEDETPADQESSEDEDAGSGEETPADLEPSEDEDDGAEDASDQDQPEDDNSDEAQADESDASDDESDASHDEASSEGAAEGGHEEPSDTSSRDEATSPAAQPVEQL